MTSTQKTGDTSAVPLSTVSITRQNFVFPDHKHLLIATPRHVFSWDNSGIRKVFRSSRNGIIAVREAKDGSGILAVASKDVVVLHDTKRGREQSWGLNAQEEEVRHLEYSNDAKSLYLSTKSDGLIQHYSTEYSRLLEPLQRHESDPTALAVSSSGDLVLSASCRPPALYLKSLSRHTPSSFMMPRASTSAVCAATFHPDRPTIFMLAFQDGTVAAYDSARILAHAGKYGSQGNGDDGEICSLQHLHRKTITDDPTSAIARAVAPVVSIAFLAGHKHRAVTSGADGRCRLIDFAGGGAILRTWRCGAACTALGVVTREHKNVRQNRWEPTRDSWKEANHDITSLIAVGLVDGKVHIYDALGFWLHECLVISREERIISLEWAHGLSPNVIENDTGTHVDDTASTPLTPTSRLLARSLPEGRKQARSDKEATSRIGLGLPPGLRKTQPPAQRRLTIHPDELAALAVQRHSNMEASLPLRNGQAATLSSPARSKVPSHATRGLGSSQHRHRPRISSQTFVKDPVQYIRLGGPRKPKLALSHSSINTSRSSSPVRQRHIRFKSGAKNLGDATIANSQRSSKTGANVNALAHVRATAANPADQRFRDSVVAEQSFAKVLRKCDSNNEFDIWLTSEDEIHSHQTSRHRQKQSDIVMKSARADSAGVRYNGDKSHAPHRSAPRVLDGSTEEEMVTAPSDISPGLSAVSGDVRGLFPRTSSLPPNEARVSHKAATRLTSPRSRQSLLPPSTRLTSSPNTRQLKTPWTRARACRSEQQPTFQRNAVRKNAYVTILHDSSVEEPQLGLTKSPSYACLSCPQTQALVRALEPEVIQLRGKIDALKAALKRSEAQSKVSLR